MGPWRDKSWEALAANMCGRSLLTVEEEARAGLHAHMHERAGVNRDGPGDKEPANAVVALGVLTDNGLGKFRRFPTKSGS